MLLREIKLMKLLDHPNIIKIYEVFRAKSQLYLVMELCQGGDQFDHLYAQPGAKYTEEYARNLLTKMLRALAYLHANQIVHRDLKLENFILTDRTPSAEIKMIDFGLSRAYLVSTSMSNVVGYARARPPRCAGSSSIYVGGWVHGRQHV